MDLLIQDVRYGVRQLLRQRGSSLVAIVTLALGIGVSTAIFSVVDATMLRPMPYPNPEQLVTVSRAEVQPDGELSRPTPSMEDMRTWQSATDVFSAVAGRGSAFRGRIVDGPKPERIQVMHFTEDYLSMHGVKPVIGRDFVREDTDLSSPLVALLGYGYWRTAFGGRENVLGETIRLEDDIATIVGVLPPGFNSTTPLYTPLRIDPKEFARRGTGRVSVYARLRPDITLELAQERLSARMPGWTGPKGTAGEVRVLISSRLESALKSYGTTVKVLAWAVALILLIASVNVAGLLLARGSARQTELAVRASLGAGRGRLIRQLLTESVVLAIPGGLLGVLLAWVSLDTIVANIPMTLPANSPVTLNWKVLAATATLLVPTSLLFGLLPALRLSRVRIGSVLARGSRQVSSTLSTRGSQVLIAAEIALAVVLVAGAALMIRSFVRISAVDLGFNPDGLVTMQVLPLDRTPEAHKTYYSALLHRLRNTPGVASAGIVDNFALGGGGTYSSVRVGDKPLFTTIFDVTPGYFEAIGATLKAGRLPTDADYSSGFAGVVLNESAARKLFTDRPAVGQELTNSGLKPKSWTVVGVVGDLRHGGPLNARSEGEPQVFFPLEPSESDIIQAMTVVIRPAGKQFTNQELRTTAESIGPRVLIEKIRTGDELFGETVITPRRRTVLLGLLGALGMALALVGVFGMTGYAVTRRTSEIGVRMAFGARPGQVVRTMVRDAALPIVVGTLLGVGGATLASRVIESFLFKTERNDPATLAAVAGVLVIAGCIAALVPALRAARIDPASCLRAD